MIGNKIETKYFNVFYDDADNNIVEDIVKVVDGMYDEIMQKFDLNNPTYKVSFKLCPDRDVFKKETGKSDEEYQDWMVGNSSYESKTICVLSPNIVTDRSYEDMVAVIKHEIVHMALSQIKPDDEADIMIAEGVAVAFAQQIWLGALSEENYPDIRKMSDEKYFYENEGYNYSGVYILYLLRRIGVEEFKKVYAGEVSIEEFLYDGFELDAIRSVLGK